MDDERNFNGMDERDGMHERNERDRSAAVSVSIPSNFVLCCLVSVSCCAVLYLLCCGVPCCAVVCCAVSVLLYLMCCALSFDGGTTGIGWTKVTVCTRGRGARP